MLGPGDRAPAIEGKDHDGNPVSLEALRARGPVVVFFYPKDFTPVCTREACAFEEAYGPLEHRGVTVIGVSADDDESHRRFAKRHGLSFPLISDPDRALARAFGALHPLGLGAKRATFVIDQGGIVRAAIHSELRANKHVKEAIAALERLS
jgi:peroxiredoxin Q/BCP